MHIEKVTPADITAISELLSVLFALEAKFIEVKAKGLAQIINNSAVSAVLVAKEGAQIVRRTTAPARHVAMSLKRNG